MAPLNVSTVIPFALKDVNVTKYLGPNFLSSYGYKQSSLEYGPERSVEVPQQFQPVNAPSFL